VAVILLAWWWARSPRAAPALGALALLAAAACAALLPQTWRSWTVRDYTDRRVAQFAELRRHIPAGAEVFWPESPLAVWMLLDRPSYLSVIQTSGMVFSRDTARELERRAAALRAAVDPGIFMRWGTGGTGMTLSAQQLESACGAREFDFLVTHADLGRQPVADIPAASGAPGRGIRLYRCPG
jgi:hypothetical protein